MDPKKTEEAIQHLVDLDSHSVELFKHLLEIIRNNCVSIENLATRVRFLEAKVIEDRQKFDL